MATLLVERGADVDKANTCGETPLHVASSVSIDNLTNAMFFFFLLLLFMSLTHDETPPME